MPFMGGLSPLHPVDALGWEVHPRSRGGLVWDCTVELWVSLVVSACLKGHLGQSKGIPEPRDARSKSHFHPGTASPGAVALVGVEGAGPELLSWVCGCSPDAVLPSGQWWPQTLELSWFLPPSLCPPTCC